MRNCSGSTVLLVEHGVAEEAGGDDLVLGRVGEQVAGVLFDDELVVGQVAVEGVDHPIPAKPTERGLSFSKPSLSAYRAASSQWRPQRSP